MVDLRDMSLEEHIATLPDGGAVYQYRALKKEVRVKTRMLWIWWWCFMLTFGGLLGMWSGVISVQRAVDEALKGTP